MRPPDASRPPRRLRNQTMPPPAPSATEIPRWPKITATLNADGTGVLTIDGRDQPLDGADVDTARSVVLERVTATAATVGRPVRLHSSDPDGDWTLAVHPDGHVDELAARPAAVAPAMPVVAIAGSPPRPVGRAAARSMRPTPGSRRLAGRVAAGLGLLAGIAVILALLITNGPATVVRDHTPSTPTRSAPLAADNARDTAAVAAQRARQAVDRARQRATLKRSVAARQARRRRAARRRAAARRSARNARPATAAPRPSARPARRTSPPPTPARSTPPARPAPATSASPQCGEFDLC